MDACIWKLLTVMLLAGIFGGLVNYYLSDEKEIEKEIEEKVNKKKSLQKSLIIGIGASFLVPMFLNMISSGLLSDSCEDNLKLLVFAGFCLIAAISSRAFISTISDRILDATKAARKEVENARMELSSVQSEIAPLIEKETEGDEEEVAAESIQESREIDNIIAGLDETEKTVLNALGLGPYTYRSISGLTKETNLDKELVHKTLNSLINRGLVSQSLRKKGLRWYLSEKGILSFSLL